LNSKRTGAEQWIAAGGDGWREPMALANKCGLCQVRAHVLRSCSPDCGLWSPETGLFAPGPGEGMYEIGGWWPAMRVKLKNALLVLPCFSRLLFGFLFAALFILFRIICTTKLDFHIL